jgi:ribose transport system substrate-binding protein
VKRPSGSRRALHLTGAVVMAAIVGLSVAACGGGGDSSASTGASGQQEQKEVSVGIELPLTGVQFAQEIKLGAEQAAEAAGGVDLSVNGPPTIEPVAAQKQVSDMLATGLDAMGVDAFPPEAWQRTMTTLTEELDYTLAINDKPINTPEEVSSSPIKTFVGVSAIGIARTLAEETIAAAGLGPDTTGVALVGQCVPGNAGTLYERTQGFSEVIEKKLPKVTVKVFDSQVEPAANTGAWSDALNATPDPAIAFGTCDQDSASIYKVKREKNADFAAGALEASPSTMSGIKDGTYDAAVASNWYLLGYGAVQMLVEAARDGKPVPEGWLDPGFTPITKKNVAEIEARGASVAAEVKWYAPKVKALLGDVEASMQPMTAAFE